MSDHVEYRTTNGHIVLMDRADWLTLEPMLEGGVRLQAQAERDSVKVRLREYGRPGMPTRTILLSKALLGASESQGVLMLNGPLDHRRSSMELFEEGRRQGWASRIHAGMREGDKGP